MKKRIISSVVSLVTLSLSLTAMLPTNIVSAEETKTPEIPEWTFGLPEERFKISEEEGLEEIIASYGEDAFVHREGDRLVTIITPQGNTVVYTNNLSYSVLTMKDGTEPPAELLNNRTFCYKYPDTNQYISYTEVDKYYDILKEDENVISLDTYRRIYPVQYRFDSLAIPGDVSAEEFIYDYSALNLTISSVSDERSLLRFGHIPDSPEVYAAFMKLQNSGIDYELMVCTTLEERITDTLYLEHVITSEEDNISDTVTASTIRGDINADGKIDVTDLTELSLALLGDSKLTSVQQKAADVDESGNIKLTDLATLKQYLSKQIESLG